MENLSKTQLRSPYMQSGYDLLGRLPSILDGDGFPTAGLQDDIWQTLQYIEEPFQQFDFSDLQIPLDIDLTWDCPSGPLTQESQMSFQSSILDPFAAVESFPFPPSKTNANFDIPTSAISNAASASSTSSTRSNSLGSTAGVSVRPHYASERRYRASLNGKLSELDRSIPPLDNFDPHWASQTNVRENGKTSTSNNKAFVLEKAIRYIRHLEKNHQAKQETLHGLKKRVQLSLVLLNGQNAAITSQDFPSDPMSENMSLLV